MAAIMGEQKSLGIFQGSCGMNARIRLVALLVGLGCFAVSPLVRGQSEPGSTFLLNVSKGQTFSDIGSEDKTKPVPVDPQDLSKGLKVVFHPNDSVGVQTSLVKNWKPYQALHIAVGNPSDKPVKLGLYVIHSGTKNYQTRVSKILDVPPGDHDLETPIASLLNLNGSAPTLSEVRRWYLADYDKVGPTLIFRDVWLSGGPSETPAATGSIGLKGKYRIKGRVGTQEVDLILEPADEPATGGAAAAGGAATRAPLVVHSDPPRLERIRAATMPAIEQPVAFDTPQADAICSALEVFPPDNPWNTVIEDWPLHPNSRNIVASAGVDKPFRYNRDMGFILIPPDQKPVSVKLAQYASESDKGPYPLPDATPIEGWPVEYPGMTLPEVQQKIEKGDRHAIVVDPARRMLFEFYQLRKLNGAWVASGAAIFDLKSNKLRPAGWTSTDAAGLPIFPAVVRYDELQRGIVEHAMRVTVVKTRRSYVYPATHFASRHNDENFPRMGERLRLRKDFDESGCSPEVQAIARGLKKYGMFVADNGQDWAISVAPDPRMNNFALELRKIKGGDFEVVEPPPGYQPP